MTNEYSILSLFYVRIVVAAARPDCLLYSDQLNGQRNASSLIGLGGVLNQLLIRFDLNKGGVTGCVRYNVSTFAVCKVTTQSTGLKHVKLHRLRLIM